MFLTAINCKISVIDEINPKTAFGTKIRYFRGKQHNAQK
jgi:hypothetical protein